MPQTSVPQPFKIPVQVYANRTEMHSRRFVRPFVCVTALSFQRTQLAILALSLLQLRHWLQNVDVSAITQVCDPHHRFVVEFLIRSLP